MKSGPDKGQIDQHLAVAGVLAERGEVYGDAAQTHARIAEVWSGILGHTVTAHEVALCMVGLKLVRASCAPGHEDSYLDAAAYTTIAENIAGQTSQNQTSKNQTSQVEKVMSETNTPLKVGGTVTTAEQLEALPKTGEGEQG